MDTFLKRAEKLFRKGSFELAKKEFEIVYKNTGQEELTERIKICDKEINIQKAGELLKKGRRLQKKKRYKEALDCYKQAYTVRKEDWIKEKITQLNNSLSGHNLAKEAETKEAARKYEEAADIYSRLHRFEQQEELLEKQAVCLVKAEKYKEAAGIFLNINTISNKGRYFYGFALAEMGKYFDSVKIWDKVDSECSEFAGQREFVKQLLVDSLYKKAAEGNFSEVYSQTKNLTNDNLLSEKLKGLSEYCKFAFIGQLWEEDKFEKILKMLMPYPLKLNSVLLDVYAKTYYKLAEKSSEYLYDAVSFWLSSIYNNIKDDSVRQVLLDNMEQLINKYQSLQNPSDGILTHWKIEKRSLEQLSALRKDIPELSGNILTPHIYELFKDSGNLSDILKNNMPNLPCRDKILEVAVYFSGAKKSLYYIENEEYEKAIKGLPAYSMDEFSEYGRQKVCFEYAMAGLESGRESIKKYFLLSGPLIKKNSDYMDQLFDKLMETEDINSLSCLEDVFKYLLKEGGSKKAATGLSLAMSHKTISMLNKRMLKANAAQAILLKSLKIDQENEHARCSLDYVKDVYEYEKMDSAMYKGDLRKASNIAAATDNAEIHEMFFEHIEYNLGMLDKESFSDEQKISILNKVYKDASNVDCFHPILSDIREKINQLERRYA